MSSRVGRKPILLPKGVEVTIEGQQVTVKGAKGMVHHTMHPACSATIEDHQLIINAHEKFPDCNIQAGTARAILNNHVQGVSVGFMKKLLLVGV